MKEVIKKTESECDLKILVSDNVPVTGPSLRRFAKYIEHPEENGRAPLNETDKIYGIAHMKDNSYKLFYIGAIDEGINDLKNMNIINQPFDENVEQYHVVVSRTSRNRNEKFAELAIGVATRDECWEPYDMRWEIKKSGFEVATWKELCREALPERCVLPGASGKYKTIVYDLQENVDKVDNVSDIFDIQKYFENKGLLKNIDGVLYESSEMEGTGINIFNFPGHKELLTENKYLALQELAKAKMPNALYESQLAIQQFQEPKQENLAAIKNETLVLNPKKEELWPPYDKEEEIKKNGPIVAMWKEKCRETIPNMMKSNDGKEAENSYYYQAVVPNYYQNIVTNIKSAVDSVTNNNEIFDMLNFLEGSKYIQKIDNTNDYEAIGKFKAAGLEAFNVPSDIKSLKLLAQENGYMEMEQSNVFLLNKVKQIIGDKFFDGLKTINGNVEIRPVENIESQSLGNTIQSKNAIKM